MVITRVLRLRFLFGPRKIPSHWEWVLGSMAGSWMMRMKWVAAIKILIRVRMYPSILLHVVDRWDRDSTTHDVSYTGCRCFRWMPLMMTMTKLIAPLPRRWMVVGRPYRRMWRSLFVLLVGQCHPRSRGRYVKCHRSLVFFVSQWLIAKLSNKTIRLDLMYSVPVGISVNHEPHSI